MEKGYLLDMDLVFDPLCKTVEPIFYQIRIFSVML